MTKFESVMLDMHWKPWYQTTAKCVWRNCDGAKAGPLFCLYHKHNTDGRKIGIDVRY